MKTKTKTEDRSNDREKRKNWDGWYGTVGYCMPLQDAGRTTIIYSRPSSSLFYLFHPTSNQKHDKKQSLNPRLKIQPLFSLNCTFSVSYLYIQSNITKATDN